MAARGQWIAVGVIVALLAGALVAGMALSPELNPVRPGSEAPNFEAVDVVNGETVSFSEYDGEIVLLNLWATWCPPCVEEMPSIQRLHEELGPSGLKVVAVSMDQAGTDEVLAWAQERGLTFDILHDRTGNVDRLYQTTGLPESFVIGRDGVIIRKEISAREWDSPSHLEMFRRLLDQEGSSP
jgi:peroxiredoxin